MSAPAGFPFRVLLLTGASFVSVTSEFLPTAVLPQIAEELRVSESQVGLLVSLFALIVVLATTPLAIATRRFSRKWLLVVLLGCFALANLFAAAAPSYEMLIAARIFGGLTHGLFWAMVGPYAATLVPRTQLARSISLVTAGGTIAFVVGMPAGAAIGVAVGWRMSFVVAAAAGLLLVGFVAWLLPTVRPEDRVGPPVTRPNAVVAPGSETAGASTPPAVRAPRDRSLIAMIIVAVSAIIMATGHLVLYAYITPWALDVGDVGAPALSVVLGTYGVSGLVGVVVAGAFGDRYPRLVVNLMMASMLGGLVALGLWGHNLAVVVVCVAFWGAGFAGLPAAIQTRILHSASARWRDLSGAVNSIAFNFAIASGALLGGVLLDGFGLASLPWFAASLVALAIVWTITTDRLRIRVHPADAHRG